MSNNSDIRVGCPLCSSKATIQLFTKESINYHKCNSCFFVFSKPDVNFNFQEKIESFEDAYINYFDFSQTDNKNLNLLFKWIADITDLKNKRVLDVGCGSGKFVRYLANKGIDVIGLEPSKPLYERYLNDREFFYNNSVEEFIDIKPGNFDIVTLFDVLEHVEYPAQLIREISMLQEENSFLLVEIPLYSSFPASLMGKRWHFFNKYHLSYFGKNRLIKLFNDSGYQLVNSRLRGKYFNVDYLLNYVKHFMGVKSNLKFLSSFHGQCIYINPLDIYIACFRKGSS